MVAVYLDESRRDEVGVLTIAGFVFTGGGGAQYEKHWRRALALPPGSLDYLHMKELTKPKGVLSRWSADDERRYFERLSRVIHRNIEAAVAVAVDTEAFAAYQACHAHLLDDVTVYSLAVTHFLTLVNQRYGKDEPINVWLDDVTNPTVGKGRIKTEFEDARRRGHLWHQASTLNWASKMDYPQLQAADYFAHGYAEAFSLLLRGTPRPLRPRFAALMNGLKQPRLHYRYITAEFLEANHQALVDADGIKHYDNPL